MRFLLLPLGSMGDVLPFCALGRRLAQRGHEVTIAANPHFAGTVAEAGLHFVPLGAERDYLQLIDSAHFMSRTLGFRRVMSWARTLLSPTYELVCAHRDATVIAHPLAFGARVAEAQYGVRTATLLLSPAVLGSAHSPPVMPGILNSPSLPHWYKRSVWWAVDRLILDPMIAPELNALRSRIGAPRIARVFQEGWRSDHLFLALFPEWFAPRQPDWPRNLVLTGFPLYDGAARASDSRDGEIVFTPGTGNRRTREFFAAAVEATAHLGRRARFLTPFADQLPALPPHVRHSAYAPLGDVLRRASALVHHAGIGTAASALAAGVPQLVTPFAHDQPDNAARLRRLGVAEELRKMRAPDMASALHHLLLSANVSSACRAAQQRMASVDSLLAAALALENYSVEAAA